MPKKILTIAGSDTLAGGGLLTDVKTFEDYGHFGLSVITCIATVNEQHEFQLENLAPDLIQAQLNSIKSTMNLDGIKIGLLNSLTTIDLVADFLTYFPNVPVVLDPVLAFKESNQRSDQQYIEAMIKKLLPLATLITPNLTEASLLSQQSIKTIEDMEQAGERLLELGANSVLIKGGQRLSGTAATDLYLAQNKKLILSKEKISSNLVNGAGCMLAAALIANLVSQIPLDKTLQQSKDYVYTAIQHGVLINPNFGNVWHNYQSLGKEHVHER